jgi:hypothetical protein
LGVTEKAISHWIENPRVGGSLRSMRLRKIRPRAPLQKRAASVNSERLFCAQITRTRINENTITCNDPAVLDLLERALLAVTLDIANLNRKL